MYLHVFRHIVACVKARHPGALGTISSGPGATCSGLRGSRTSSAWDVCIVQMMFIKYKCRAVFSVDLDRRRAQSVCVARRDRYPVQLFRINRGKFPLVWREGQIQFTDGLSAPTFELESERTTLIVFA